MYLYILYLGMLVKKLFHFCWINVLSSADDQILQDNKKVKSRSKQIVGLLFSLVKIPSRIFKDLSRSLRPVKDLKS